MNYLYSFDALWSLCIITYHFGWIWKENAKLAAGGNTRTVRMCFSSARPMHKDRTLQLARDVAHGPCVCGSVSHDPCAKAEKSQFALVLDARPVPLWIRHARTMCEVGFSAITYRVRCTTHESIVQECTDCASVMGFGSILSIFDAQTS